MKADKGNRYLKLVKQYGDFVEEDHEILMELLNTKVLKKVVDKLVAERLKAILEDRENMLHLTISELKSGSFAVCSSFSVAGGELNYYAQERLQDLFDSRQFEGGADQHKRFVQQLMAIMIVSAQKAGIDVEVRGVT